MRSLTAGIAESAEKKERKPQFLLCVLSDLRGLGLLLTSRPVRVIPGVLPALRRAGGEESGIGRAPDSDVVGSAKYLDGLDARLG